MVDTVSTFKDELADEDKRFLESDTDRYDDQLDTSKYDEEDLEYNTI